MLNKKHRSVLANIHCGVAPLVFETGRNVGRIMEDRVCFNFPMEVIFIMTFAINYFYFHKSKDNDFRQFSPKEKLSYLFSNENVENKTATPYTKY